MAVPKSKVTELCTSTELALVMASRRPQLNQLTLAEVKRLAIRARKLSDKATDQGRAQARAKSAVVGAGIVPTRTQLKSQVFADALTIFEARQAKLEAASAGATASTAPAKSKAVRAAGHRATRAKVRKSLADK